MDQEQNAVAAINHCGAWPLRRTSTVASVAHLDFLSAPSSSMKFSSFGCTSTMQRTSGTLSFSSISRLASALILHFQLLRLHFLYVASSKLFVENLELTMLKSDYSPYYLLFHGCPWDAGRSNWALRGQRIRRA
jgi:hypothetical protein